VTGHVILAHEHGIAVSSYTILADNSIYVFTLIVEPCKLHREVDKSGSGISNMR